jgi:hypothetical protein
MGEWLISQKIQPSCLKVGRKAVQAFEEALVWKPFSAECARRTCAGVMMAFRVGDAAFME